VGINVGSGEKTVECFIENSGTIQYLDRGKIRHFMRSRIPQPLNCEEQVRKLRAARVRFPPLSDSIMSASKSAVRFSRCNILARKKDFDRRSQSSCCQTRINKEDARCTRNRVFDLISRCFRSRHHEYGRVYMPERVIRGVVLIVFDPRFLRYAHRIVSGSVDYLLALRIFALPVSSESAGNPFRIHMLLLFRRHKVRVLYRRRKPHMPGLTLWADWTRPRLAGFQSFGKFKERGIH